MSKKNRKTESEQQENEPQSTTKNYFYFAIAACALGVIAFVLGVALPSLIGVYGVIAAILCELACLAFLTTQKKKNNFKAVKYLLIISYILVGLFVLFMIGGIIYMNVA